MHKSTSPKRKSFILYTMASTLFVAVGGAFALFAGVTPAVAANLATQPDTQIAVFMVPLTLLVLAILFEVARISLRGSLPVEAPVTRTDHRHWLSGNHKQRT